MYVDDYGLTALLICVFQNITPEQAFRKLENKTYKYTKLSEEDMLDMLKMRDNGMTLKSIGECYGISESEVCRRLGSFRKRRVV